MKTLTKLTQMVMLIGLLAMASAAAYNQGYVGNNTSLGKQYGNQREFFEDMSGAFGDVANQRFKASMNRGVYSFILTDVGEGVGLVKVDKVSGKEEGKIVLNDKEPIYDSDPENGMIFYKPTKKEVFGYVF
ncbi:hypothetical protein [Algoriphagus terrigena]|uniref:hypothetical protein n=1 Tax=Algoriphagus terrigena TaxID=344884 RepID=UPI0012FC0CB3|nr:hypothetical protein [Algoriphagus terrigena]